MANSDAACARGSDTRKHEAGSTLKEEDSYISIYSNCISIINLEGHAGPIHLDTDLAAHGRRMRARRAVEHITQNHGMRFIYSQDCSNTYNNMSLLHRIVKHAEKKGQGHCSVATVAASVLRPQCGSPEQRHSWQEPTREYGN